MPDNSSKNTARRVGIWLVGACGGVGTTVAVGLAALARGLTDTTGLATGLPIFAGADFDDFGAMVVGGHDIRKADFVHSAEEMHRRAGVFDGELLRACRGELEQWSAHICAGTVHRTNATIRQLADLPEAQRTETAWECLQRLQNDLRSFQEKNQLHQVVVINVASTEPPFTTEGEIATHSQLTERLRSGQLELPASSLYALAAIESGMPYINFTPSLGADLPAIQDLAVQKNVPICGKDGKTGETLMKSVLAPMFAHRNLHVMSWVGHNIFGNRDGVVLNDPANKSSKVQSKDQLLSQILGYKPQTLVSIEYIESLDDWKTAWDHIHFRGFLNTKMILQFIWQGCDSLLAAPLVIDLARLTLLAQRRGEGGVLKHLSAFFKSPMNINEHHFFRQFAWLEEYAAKLQK